jgi:nitrogen-specific signal transduction histidine kinase/DNA-binding NarL/FixJ family response regulator
LGWLQIVVPMKTLLVLAPHPELAEGVRHAVNPERYKIIHRTGVEEAEPLLTSARADVVILDVELTDVQGIWVLEKIRRLLPQSLVIVFTGARQPQWEEEAYLQGVAHILSKPVRPRLFNTVLERVVASMAPASTGRSETRAAVSQRPATEARTTPSSRSATETLSVLQDFSGILTHSLCAEALLKQFLLLLREILGVNRAAIFLRQPVSPLTRISGLTDARRLHSACALGLPSGLLEHFELSFETGIGGHVFRHGRIVRSDQPEALNDVEMQKEFELLGAQVAIPILDRETFVGVAAFDGRVTGEPLANGELELIFHLLEQLGLAVRNIWLHEQLAANHGMLADILRELSSACVVVSRELDVLHANRAAGKLFPKSNRQTGELEFSDLPQALGSRVYQVLKTGAGVAPFKFQPPESPQKLFHVSVVPFVPPGSSTPTSALLMVDDHTQAEQFRKLELEAANLRLVKSMAERLAHEVGNALVPLSTHQQLLGEKFKDPEFRASLDLALSETVKRVSRLTSQMRYLARDAVVNREAVPLSQLIDDAFKEARKYQPVKSSKLDYADSSQPIILSGDKLALKYALTEVMLNAIQANTADAKVAVRAHTDADPQGSGWVHIDITDNGGGFTPEAAERVPAPFFTTRTVGLGLGLCVTRKILETHQGHLSLLAGASGQPGTVRISLPLATSQMSKN